MFAPLNRIVIYVGDVPLCAAFYQRVFGFTVIPSGFDPAGWIELETGGCRLGFIQANGPAGPMTEPTGGEMNPHKIVFQVADVAAARNEALARGAELGAIRTYGSLVMCDGKDPEGHVFQLSNLG